MRSRLSSRVTDAAGELVKAGELQTTCEVDFEAGTARLVSQQADRRAQWTFVGSLVEGDAMRFVMEGAGDGQDAADSYMLSRAADDDTLLNTIFVRGRVVSLEIIRLLPDGRRVQQAMRLDAEGQYAGAAVYQGERR